MISNTCTIVAGGESVNLIPEFIGYRIGVNHTYKYREVDCTVAWDDMLGNRTDIPNLHTLSHRENPNATLWEIKAGGIHRDGVSIMQANSSSIFAINVAIQLGYKTIYCVGMDNKANRATHFYTTHHKYKKTYVDRYAQLFDMLRPHFQRIELLEDERLIFVNSTIDFFENITAEEYNDLVKKSL